MSTTKKSINKLGKLIAVGGTAEIYAWKPGWVLKLYFDRYTMDMAEFEHHIATVIYGAGLPAPVVGEIVSVNGRVGLLYKRLEGERMDIDLAKHPRRLFSHARRLAELHAELHARPIEANIPRLRRRLEYKLKDAKPLPEDLRLAALKALETMPDGDRLCHGDFHPGNILVSQHGPVIIDWIDSSVGSPLADVARTSILALGMAATQPCGFFSWGIRFMHAIYLRRYFRLRPGGNDEYRRWLPIVAAARLNENVPDWYPWLLEQASTLF